MKILIIMMVCSITAYGQKNIDGTPLGFMYPNLISTLQTETMPVLNMKKLAVEDSTDRIADQPPRGGYGFPVDYTMDNAGVWKELPDGSRVWFLKIKANDAIAIILNFDKFWLPDGGRLYFYSADGNEKMGGYSSQNNKGSSHNPSAFSTGLLFSEEGILEYHEPSSARNQAILHLTSVTQIYRFFKKHNTLKDFGTSKPCEEDINCPDGNDWQIEKTGIAMLLENQNGNYRFCSGTLINNANNDGTPFFLTASHCLDDYHVSATGSLTSGSWNLSNISFMWGYESSSCAGGDGPTNIITSGASLIANNDQASGSDFALLLLDETPFSIGFDAQFNGWDISTSAPANTATIHHPDGDVKKISIDNNAPSMITRFNASVFLKDYWMTAFTIGGTEGGSSGAPLFDGIGKKVIGQLLGGDAIDCDNPGSYHDVFGAINQSWTGSATSSLQMWLDQPGVHTSIGGGHLVSCTDRTLSGSQNSDETITALSVNSTQQISSGHSVTYTAQNFILLNPGFIAEPNFIAQIGSCSSTFVARESHIGNKNPISQTPVSNNISSVTCHVYPNPTTAGFNLDYNTTKSCIVNVQLINQMGQTVTDAKYNRDAGTQSDYFDISQVAAGIYHIQATIDGELHSFKLNKE